MDSEQIIKQVKKRFWNDAAVAGLVCGLILGIVFVLEYTLRISTIVSESVLNIIYLGTTFIVPFIYAKRHGAWRGKRLGFSFTQALGFICISMMFAGIIYGVINFIMIYIDPESYVQQIELTISSLNGIDDVKKEEMLTQSVEMMKKPLVIVLGGSFFMFLQGIFVGLIVSAFVKRPADPFSDELPQINNEETK